MDKKKSVREELGIPENHYKNVGLDKVLTIDDILAERKSRISYKEESLNKNEASEKETSRIVSFQEIDSIKEEKQIAEKSEKELSDREEENLVLLKITEFEKKQQEKLDQKVSIEQDEVLSEMIEEQSNHSSEETKEEDHFKLVLEDYEEGIDELDELPDFIEEEEPKNSSRFSRWIASRENQERYTETEQLLEEELHPLDELEDKDAVRHALHQKVAMGGKSVFFGGFFAVLLVILSLLKGGEKSTPAFLQFLHSAWIYESVNLVFFLLFGLCAWPYIKQSIELMKEKKWTSGFLFTCAMVLVLFLNLLSLILKPSVELLLPLNGVLGFSGAFFLGAEQSRNKKVRADHKFLCSKSEKETTAFSFSDSIYEERNFLTATLQNPETQPLYRFFTNAYDTMPHDKGQRVFAGLAAICALAVGLIGAFVFHMNFLSAYSSAVLVFCMFLPVTLFLGDNFVFRMVGKKLREAGAVVVGYNSVNLVSEIDEVVLQDSDLFPEKHVSLCGIKVYGDGKIDEIIVETASILGELTGATRTVLHDVLDHRTELLKPVEKLEFGKGGVQAIIEGHLLFCGNREYMKKNYVRLPEDGLYDKLCESDKQPFYIAEDGQLVALLSFKYSIDQEISKVFRQALKLGVGIKVATRDPIITSELISRKCGIDLPFEVIAPQDEEGICDEPTLVVTKGNIRGYIQTICDCLRLRNIFTINRLVAWMNIAVAVFLILLVMFTGTLTYFTMLNFLLLQLLWVLPILVLSFITKWMS